MKWVSRIPYNEFTFEFARSGGPGGQHVNKTNSAAILRWDVDATLAFSEDQKVKLQTKLKLNQESEVVIRSEEHRDQEKNKKRCLEKLDSLIEKALFVHKKRKPTKPSRSQKEKRIKSKKIRSEVKKSRTNKDW
ncbi:MAG: alternative ribosome rescue aminoacyl-tRNA hydrolase ArfB [Bdellovibrionota bacterium]